MSDTVIRGRKISIWAIFQALIIMGIAGLAAWMFYTIDDLQKEVSEIRANRRENAAQWASLADLNETVKSLSVEIEVTKRMFDLMIQQGTLRVSTISKSSLPSAEPEVSLPPREPREERTHKFRQEQMQMAPTLDED